MKLDKKYVLHIPEYKFTANQLIKLELDKPLDDLKSRLEQNGYENFYLSKIKGFYKNREYDEIIITLFIAEINDQTLPDEIFIEWFKDNNEILKQESLAYEINNSLFIEELI